MLDFMKMPPEYENEISWEFITESSIYLFFILFSIVYSTFGLNLREHGKLLAKKKPP